MDRFEPLTEWLCCWGAYAAGGWNIVDSPQAAIRREQFRDLTQVLSLISTLVAASPRLLPQVTILSWSSPISSP